MPLLQKIIDLLNKIQSSVAGISVPTAGQNADAVWDEATSGHATAGTTGKALTDILAGIGGVPSAKIDIVEEHLHPHSWFATNEPSVAITVTTGGQDTYGNWAKVTDAASLPALGTYWDIQQHLLTNFSHTNKRYVVQLGYGDGTVGGTTVIGKFAVWVNSGTVFITPVFSPGTRVLSNGSSHLYARTKTDSNNGQFNYYGIAHIY